MKTSIVLADAQKLFRDGLRTLLAAAPDLEIVGEASNTLDALDVVRATSPDVVILDVLLPVTGGVDFALELLRQDPTQRIAAHDGSAVAEALRPGILGCATKNQPLGELIAGIRAVANQQTEIAPILPPGVEPGGQASVLASLTRREREVFVLTVDGMATAEIATHLFISRRTVETHRSRILRKLGVHSAADLVRLAARLGFLLVESGVRVLSLGLSARMNNQPGQRAAAPRYIGRHAGSWHSST